MIPQNAAPIIAARLKGMKPQEMIRISLVGTLCNGNHPVYAKAGEPADWRWVRDLDVCLYIGPSMDWAGTLKAIALERPAHLSLWESYEHWGAKVYLIPTWDDIKTRHVSQWQYELDFLPWMDFQNEEFLQCN